MGIVGPPVCARPGEVGAQTEDVFAAHVLRALTVHNGARRAGAGGALVLDNSTPFCLPVPARWTVVQKCSLRRLPPPTPRLGQYRDEVARPIKLDCAAAPVMRAWPHAAPAQLLIQPVP